MKDYPSNSVSGLRPSFEDTLHLIAQVPVPEGLAERVQAGLDSELKAGPRRGRVLAWPVKPSSSTNWMRSAAAAAIVFVVAGGGWGVYSHVQPGPTAKGATPPHVAAPGGFSNAGAMRTPQTLIGPVLTHQEAQPQSANPAAKVPTQAAQKHVRHAKSSSANKAAPAAK
jgi:hypothetical protein